jgi:hypothetical protein
MEVVVLILIVILYAWFDDDEEEASADPVALALPTLQELEREAQQALAEIRTLDGDDGRQP